MIDVLKFEHYIYGMVVNSGRSSKKWYQYFVKTAHPGTFEIAPKDKKV